MQSFEKTRLSDIQRKEFESLPEQAKDLVCKGHLVKIISLQKLKTFVQIKSNSH